MEVNLDVAPDCTSAEGAFLAVGAELAMKAQSKLSGSSGRQKEAIAGLSAAFAAHRRQVRKVCTNGFY